jgi:predicted DNA-binding protein
MPTAKKRINITVDDRTYEAMERLSSERDQSVAGVGLSLIEQALEYQEDLYFSRVADDRLGKKQKRLSFANLSSGSGREVDPGWIGNDHGRDRVRARPCRARDRVGPNAASSFGQGTGDLCRRRHGGRL